MDSRTLLWKTARWFWYITDFFTWNGSKGACTYLYWLTVDNTPPTIRLPRKAGAKCDYVCHMQTTDLLGWMFECCIQRWILFSEHLARRTSWLITGELRKNLKIWKEHLVASKQAWDVSWYLLIKIITLIEIWVIPIPTRLPRNVQEANFS